MLANVACPPDETLIAYGRGQLSEAASAPVLAHLEQCPACRERVAGLSADSFINRLRGARPGDTSRPGSSVAGPGPVARGGLVIGSPPELAAHPDYTDVKELGRGGMGVVYLAQHRLLKRWEVLKVMDRRLLARSGAEDRFLQEVQAAARLHHPNVVKAYNATRLGDLVAFAMEFVPGEDLAKLVKARGPLTVARATFFVYQAALGLQHAHEKGMVHRDIKPHNLMIHKEGKKAVVKILDFGLAKLTSERKVDAGLTQTGTLMGTPDYMAPEQARDASKADIRADIYSLGCTLYFLLTGRPPFPADSLTDLMLKHASETAPRLDQVRADVPAELAAVVARMMEKDPARRYQTPAEVATALRPFFTTAGQAGGGKALAGPPDGPAEAAADVGPATAGLPTDQDVWQSLDGGSVVEGGIRGPARRARRPVWVWPAVAGSVLLFGLATLWAAGVFRLKTPHGTIVVENLPADAVVELDGGVISVARNGQNMTIREVGDGDHTVKVTIGGVEVLAQKVSVRFAGEEIRVRYEPRAVAAGKKGPASPTEPTGPAKPEPTPTEEPKTPAPPPGVVPEPMPTETPRTPPAVVPDPTPKTPSPEPTPPAPAPSEPMPGPAPEGKEASFIPLFNGKDIKNWRSLTTTNNQSNRVVWEVNDKELVGLNDTRIFYSHGFLATTRQDFGDFILRCEMKITNGGSLIGFRARQTTANAPPTGYAVIVRGHRAPNRHNHPTGAICLMEGNLVDTVLAGPAESPGTPGEWVAVEIEAVGNRLITRIDGKLAAQYVDEKSTYKSGGFVILCRTDGSRVAVRKFEVRPVAAKAVGKAPPAAPNIAPKAEQYVPLFNGKDLTGWRHPDSNPGKPWVVTRTGELQGEGNPGFAAGSSLLETTRDDFTDFRLRIQLRNTDGKTKQIYVRMSEAGGRIQGYGVAIGGATGPRGDTITIGSISKDIDRPLQGGVNWVAKAAPAAIAVGTSYTLEVSAVGNTITTFVNEKEVARFVDPDRPISQGRIRINARAETNVAIKKFDFLDLAAKPAAAVPQPAPKGPIPAAASDDAFEPNAKWVGEFTRAVAGGPALPAGAGGGGRFELTVLSRSGKTFTARVNLADIVIFVCKGTIEDGKIEWKGKDNVMEKGLPRHDYSGRLEATKLTLSYSGLVGQDGKTPVSGTATADLVAKK